MPVDFEYMEKIGASSVLGEMDNIPPTNLQKETILSTGGEDTAHACLYVEWKNYPQLRKELDHLQQIARNDPEDVESCYSVNGQGWYVERSGIGGNRNGPYLPYRLKSGGVVLGIGGFGEFRESQHNGWIEFGSTVLMDLHGLRAAWNLMQETIEAMGGEIRKNILSRVDMCVDLPGVSINEFMTPFRKRHFLSRARSIEEFEAMAGTTYQQGRQDTGWRIGKSIMLRGYDKPRELQNGADPIKRAVLEARRYGEPQETATRIEFQLRRESLKSFMDDGLRVNSIEDYLDIRGSVWNYLTHDWFRFTDGKPPKKNPERAKTLPLWKTVQKKGQEWTRQTEGKAIRHDGILKADPSALYRQGLGCFMSGVILEGSVDGNSHFLFQRIEEELLQMKHDGEYTKAIQKKIKEIKKAIQLESLFRKGA